MNTKSVLLLVGSATADALDATPGSLPVQPLINGGAMEYRKAWETPSDFKQIVGLELMIAREAVGQIYINIKTVAVNTAFPAAPSTSQTGFLNTYYITSADNLYAFLTIDASAFSSLVGVAIGSEITFVVQRDTTRAGDNTYAADLNVAGFRVTYETISVIPTISVSPRVGGITTAELISYVNRYQYFQQKRIVVPKETVYLAGSWAQEEICKKLRYLEKRVNLTLVAGQEVYQFSPQTITAATGTTPIVLTMPSHPFNTGETLFIAGCLGLTGVNGWWNTITKIDANRVSLDGSVGTGAYVASTGTAYHGLNSAFDIKHVARLEAPFGMLSKKQTQTVEDERGYFDSDSSNSIVNNYYVVNEDPFALGFRGIPDTAIKLKTIIYRKPLPCEHLSSVVDPIVTGFDKLMYRATLYQTLELLNLEESDPQLVRAKNLYEEELSDRKLELIDSRRVRKENTRALKW